MASVVEVPFGMQMVALVLVILIGLLVVIMFRSPKPDPKLELLFSLMRHFPKGEEGGDPDDVGH